MSFEHRHYPEGPSGARLSGAARLRDDEGLRNERRDEKLNAPDNFRHLRDCYDGLPHHFVDAVPGGLCDGCGHETSAGAVACADCGRCECAPCHETETHRS